MYACKERKSDRVIMKPKHAVITGLAIVLALWSIGIAGAQDGSTATITLNGDTAILEGDGAVVADNIVTITAAGTYDLSGTLADGQIIVDTQDDGPVSLILNNVDVSSSTGAPINIQTAKTVAITLAEGTQNVVTSTAAYAGEEEQPVAAILSSTDLTISGSGSLSVVSNSNDGIVSSASLTIEGAPVIAVSAGDDAIQVETVFTLTNGELNLIAGGGSGSTPSEDLSAKGIKAEENIIIENGQITIDAADDGIRSDKDLVMNAGTLAISVVGKAIHASYNLEINNGSIYVSTCDEGIEGGFITINDGTIDITALDDGINVSEPDDIPAPDLYYLHITGGTILVSADGDGLDSNGSIEMTGGTVIVNGPTAFDNGAIDYDGTFNMIGGVLIAAGSAGMPAAPSQTSSQYSALINFDNPLEAGTLVHIQTGEGDDVLTFAPGKTFQSIVYSSPALVEGASYEVYYGGSSDGTAAHGLDADGTYTPGTQQASFTISSMITLLGNIGGPGGMRPPGGEMPQGGQPMPGGEPPQGGDAPRDNMPPQQPQ